MSASFALKRMAMEAHLPDAERRHNTVDVALMAALVVLVILATLPVIRSGDLLAYNNDFFQFVSRHELLRMEILEHGHIPQRTHLYGGGFPLIGDPEDAGFNPVVVGLTLALGTVPAIKWLGILAMIAGALSVYALARRVLFLLPIPAFAAAAFYGLNTWLPVRMEDGNPNEIYAYLLPACLLCLARVHVGTRYLVALILMFALTLTNGKFTLVVNVMALLMLCGLHALSRQGVWYDPDRSSRAAWKPVKWLFLALTATTILMAFRIAPTVEFFGGVSGMSNMNLTLNDTHQYTPIVSMTYSVDRYLNQALDWNGDFKEHRFPLWMFFGWIPLLLALLGACVAWRRAWPWVVVALLFAWLSMADRAPVDLFVWLHKLPLFNTVSRPGKYFAPPVLLCVVVLAAFGMEWLLRCFNLARTRLSLGILLLALGIVPMFHRVWWSSAQSYTYEMPAPKPWPGTAGGYFQVRSRDLPIWRAGPPESLAHVNLARGVGTIDWYTGVRYPGYAVPRYFVERDGSYTANPSYRGECFWLDTGEVLPCHLSSQRITVSASTTQPRTLVINQNFHADWRVRAGTVVAHEGLLAVRVPAGSESVELRYRSTALVTGLWISAAGLLAMLTLFVLSRRWVGRREASGSAFVRGAARIIGRSKI